jgi:hypothetical protein
MLTQTILQAPRPHSESAERLVESVSTRVVEPRSTAENVAETTGVVEPSAPHARPPRPSRTGATTRLMIARSQIGTSSRLIRFPVSVWRDLFLLCCLMLLIAGGHRPLM